MKFSVLLKLIFAVTILSCCQAIGPRTFHTPLFEEKGEKQLLVVGSITSGAEVQFDYAFSNKYFLMTDVSFAYFNGFNSFAGSLGLGRYGSIGSRGKISAFGGISIGNFGPINLSIYDRNKMLLPYAGINIGIRTKYIEPILTARISSNTYLSSSNRVSYNFLAWETAATFRFGGEKLKLHAQAELSYPFNSNTGLGTVVLNVGLTFRMLNTE